jgi:CheY-like chemotaxis protein
MVLIIDDEEDLRESVRDLLLRRGYRVATAENGREALALLARIERPCLVLLDLVMPVRDGWQFLATVQADPVLAQLTIAVISAHASTHAPAGCNDLIRKPFELADLFTVVARHCGPPPAPRA